VLASKVEITRRLEIDCTSVRSTFRSERLPKSLQCGLYLCKAFLNFVHFGSGQVNAVHHPQQCIVGFSHLRRGTALFSLRYLD